MYVEEWGEDEWSLNHARAYVSALRLTISLIEKYPTKTVDEIKAILQEQIDLEINYHNVG